MLQKAQDGGEGERALGFLSSFYPDTGSNTISLFLHLFILCFPNLKANYFVFKAKYAKWKFPNNH